ncbi:hypothetical protein FRC17_000853 [Serendipita sp. 399]|nr:hypothetical protein FRC17_000853 [Serendipita sp. 399]
MAPDSESLASPMASWDQADGAMLSSPLSTAGPTRSCCGRKKHSPAGPVPTAQGDIQILAKRTIQQPLSIQSPAIIPITAPLSTPSDQPHATHRVSDVSTEMMDCLCGPDCVCLGCTKHGNKTSDDGHLPGTQGMDCPVDCPSCIDNEHGGAWPTSSFYPASNHQWNASTSGSRSFTFYPSLSTNPHAQYASTSMSESDMMGGEDTLASLNFGAGLDWLLDPDAEGDYDPDLDAEGSPNPDYIDLPAFTIEESGPSSATKTHPQVEADPKSQINHQMECCTNKECC